MSTSGRGSGRTVGLGTAAVIVAIALLMVMPLPSMGRIPNHLVTGVSLKGGGLNELGHSAPYVGTHVLSAQSEGPWTGVVPDGSLAAAQPAGGNGLGPALVNQGTSPQPLSSFAGATQLTSGGVDPADPQIAVGGIYIFEMTNEFGRITSMNGSTVYAHFTSQHFFGVVSTDTVAEGQLFFDPITSHWFVTALDITTNRVLIGVSKTSSPVGAWWLYQFHATLGTGPQYMDSPLVGNTKAFFPVSVNQYNGTTHALIGSEMIVLDKHKLELGTFSNGLVGFLGIPSVYPSRDITTNGTGTDILYAATTGSFASSTTLTEFEISGPLASLGVTTLTYTIRNTGTLPLAVQAGSNRSVTTGYVQVESVSWSSVGVLWISYGAACTPFGDATLRSCVRVDAIATSFNAMQQDTDTSVPGMYVYYGALTALTDGSGFLMVLGYSGNLSYPSIGLTGQNISDSYGTYRGPVPGFVGPSYDPSGHFGFYSGIQLGFGGTKDHAWGVSQYVLPSGFWGTQVVHFSFY